MFMSRPPYALWSIWKQLSDLQHLFVLTVCALCLYSAFSAVSTMLRLRAVKNPNSDEGISSARHCVDALRNRCANLRCVTTASFYLFGVLLLLGFQTVGSYKMDDAVMAQLLGSFVVNCAFAANVFAVFLVLHLVPWFVVSRLNTYTQRLPR
jgi:hypothetical protein